MKTTVITAQVEDYLASRRVMGFELRGEGYQLRAFARFAEQQDHAGAPTVDLALRWAQGARKQGPVTAARRLEVLRPFLTYCRQFDPAGAVVPVGLCGPGHRRLAPHIYTETEVTALLHAAQALSPAGGLRPLTYVTLFGLLAATGMRVSEALYLEREDVNLAQPAVTVRETKFKSRAWCPFMPVPRKPWRHIKGQPAKFNAAPELRRSLSRQRDIPFQSERSGRHAVSIHERRCYYRQNLWGAPFEGQDIKQVWFTGVHSDVGGSYPETQSGLSKVALEWMLHEAAAAGLQVDSDKAAVVLGKRSPPKPWMPKFVRPNGSADMHTSLHGLWWLLEFLPHRYVDLRRRRSASPRVRWRIPLGARQNIPEGSAIYELAKQCVEKWNPSFTLEPAVSFPPGAEAAYH